MSLTVRQASAGQNDRTLGAIIQGHGLIIAYGSRGHIANFASQGYTQIPEGFAIATNLDQCSIWYKNAGASEPTTLTVADPDLTVYWAELSAGITLNTHAEGADGGGGQSNTPHAGPIACAGEDFVIGVATDGTDGGWGPQTYTTPPDWTERMDLRNATDHPSVWVGTKTSAGGAETAAPLCTAAGWWSAQIASFRAAGVDAGSAPLGLSGAPEYAIEVYNSDGTFGPNVKLGEIWDARNIGWSRYDRLPGKAFFTLSQTSPDIALFVPLLTHIAIYRIVPAGATLVYRGVYIDSNDTGDDVILDFFDYKALLSVSRTGFKTLYPTKLVGTEILAPEWALAKGAGSSPLGFITTGVIEDPLGLDGVTPIKTNAQFGTLDQTRLQLFYDLSEMGRANTPNHVTFDIDLTNTFSFRKNAGSVSTLALVLGGNVSDYGFLPGWSHYRNDVATVGVGSTGGGAEITASNAAEIAAKGLRQDVTTLKTLAGVAGGTTEADQQKAALERDLNNLVQQQSSLMLRVERGKVEPFVGYALNDLCRIEISNGIDLITGQRRIVGLRCLFSEPGEDVDILVAQVAV